MNINSLDLDKVRRLEHHSARSWPATYVDHVHGWDIRRTPDIASGRVNSVNAIAPEPGRFDHVLIQSRELFALQDELPLIRIHPLAGDESVKRLEGLGLHGQGETLVKTMVLANNGETPNASCVVTDKITPEWLDAYGDAHQTDLEERQAIFRTLSSVTLQQGFAVLYYEGQPVASGRGAVADGLLGLFQIATLPAMRQRGFGRTLMNALIGWGRAIGAREAYLQVETKNDPARRLYRSLGFEEAYRYSYWWLPDDIEIENPTPKTR